MEEKALDERRDMWLTRILRIQHPMTAGSKDSTSKSRSKKSSANSAPSNSAPSAVKALAGAEEKPMPTVIHPMLATPTGEGLRRS